MDASDVLEPFRRFLDGDLTQSSIRVEQFLDGSTLVVRAEVPGIDPETDVDVSVADGHAPHQGGARGKVRAAGASTATARSSATAHFSRSVSLPPGTREEDVTATYKDGVLEVRAPAPEQAPADSEAQDPDQPRN